MSAPGDSGNARVVIVNERALDDLINLSFRREREN